MAQQELKTYNDMDTISLVVTGTLLGGIIVILKKGFNEIIKGVESIDEKLKRLEDSKNQHKLRTTAQSSGNPPD
jgi:hypothetical protein